MRDSDHDDISDDEYAWSAWLTLAVIIVGGVCVAWYYLKWW